MSRDISLRYKDVQGNSIKIEIPPPYYGFGGQRSSMAFWSIPKLKEIGVERLTILGETDPLLFFGWDELAILEREIALIAKHLSEFDFQVAAKVRWLSHLTYCFHLLKETAPTDSEPQYSIG